MLVLIPPAVTNRPFLGVADDALEQIKENAMKLVSDSHKKFASEKKTKNIRIRPMSSVSQTGNRRPFSGVSTITHKSKQTGYSRPESKYFDSQTDHSTTYSRMMSMNSTNQQYPPNKSAYYLKKAKEKEAKLDQVLALTINKVHPQHQQ